MQLKNPLVLASVSPRRQQILKEAGFSFISKSKNIPEVYLESLDKYDIPVFLSQQKASALKDEISDEIVIAADTIVALGNEILEKPLDRSHAFQMLQKLSGKVHEVISGVTIQKGDFQESFYDVTKVFFTSLSEEDINYYIDTYKPFDKAGAYGIQEYIGLIGIERIEGSYYNVMGLPIHKVILLIKKADALF
jgi:septum formation protein